MAMLVSLIVWALVPVVLVPSKLTARYLRQIGGIEPDVPSHLIPRLESSDLLAKPKFWAILLSVNLPLSGVKDSIERGSGHSDAIVALQL